MRRKVKALHATAWQKRHVSHTGTPHESLHETPKGVDITTYQLLLLIGSVRTTQASIFHSNISLSSTYCAKSSLHQRPDIVQARP